MGKDMELSPTGSISKLQYGSFGPSVEGVRPRTDGLRSSRKSFPGRRTLGVVEEKATDLTGDTSSGSNGWYWYCQQS